MKKGEIEPWSVNDNYEFLFADQTLGDVTTVLNTYIPVNENIN